VKTQKPILHGRDHAPGGTDPIPAISSSAGDYAGIVVGIPDLMGYWPMGDLETDFAGNLRDNAANPWGDKPLIPTSGTAASSYHVSGVDVPGNDGAHQFNYNQTTNSVSLSNGDYFSATDSTHHRFAATGTGQLTAAFWFAWTLGWAVPTTAVPVLMVGTQDSNISGYVPGWGVLLDPNPAGMLLTGYRGGTSDATQLTGPAVPPDTWTHTALSYDGGTLRLYMNGTLMLSDASAFSIAAKDTIRVAGGSPWNDVTNLFYGTLDEVAVWDRALNPDEISQLATGGHITTGADEDLVLGVGGDGTVGWVQPKINVTVNGNPPPATKPPATERPTDPGTVFPGVTDWILEQPFTYDGTSSFTVQPHKWTTIPFTTPLMERQSDTTGVTAWAELDPDDPDTGGWLDSSTPATIIIPHDFPFFAGADAWMQVCLRLESPMVQVHDSYRALRVFETTHQKTVVQASSLRDEACAEGGAINVARGVSGGIIFCDGDTGSTGSHDNIMIIPNYGYAYTLDGEDWLPKDVYGTPTLKAGMRLVAQVWHDAATPLTFHLDPEPSATQYKPHLVLTQGADTAWGPPWSTWY
jgi:hypothetical protein